MFPNWASSWIWDMQALIAIADRTVGKEMERSKSDETVLLNMLLEISKHKARGRIVSKYEDLFYPPFE